MKLRSITEAVSMTPPLTHHHPCGDCILQEARGGRVCPAARDAYRLPDVEVERHAQVLRALVLAEAPNHTSLIELVRQEAEWRRQELPSSSPRALPTATASSISVEPRKEAHVRSRPIQ
jgi:hypothetical protein